MRVDRLELTDYRNIRTAVLEPAPELTVICGDNGQGKTNLLEAVWLLTGGKSFRGSKDAELVRRDAEFAVLEAITTDSQRQHDLRMTVGLPGTPRPGRTVRLNGTYKGRASTVVGTFTAVVFEPSHLSLVKGSPQGRRRFLDSALCQLYPGYLAALRRYTRLITQKNALLKHYNRTPGAADMLDVFDEELARVGTILTERRRSYLQQLFPIVQKNYAEISSGREQLEMVFLPSYGQEGLLQVLHKARAVDLRAGFCTVGPHREDMEFLLDGQSARTFASQGQQRSAVLSLKLAEAAAAHRITTEMPVMLLDDVLSELDAGRQEYLLTRLQGGQTLVTACDPAAFERTTGKVYRMEQGILSPW